MGHLTLYAVTSGWDGPFQLSEVLVAEPTEEAAVASAEIAFANANQPICRAKMMIADLGRAAPGLVVGPRGVDRPLDVLWRSLDRSCDPEPAP